MTYENYDILISVSEIKFYWNTAVIICHCLRLFHPANGRDLMALNAWLLSGPLQGNIADSWLQRTKGSIPNPVTHQLLKSS